MQKVLTRVGKNCKVLNSPELVAEKLIDYLNRHPEIEKKLIKDKKLVFYTTDEVEQFKKVGEKFLGQEMVNVEKIKL